MQMKQRGLRLASMPLDWVHGRESARYVGSVIDFIGNGFSGWCDFDLLSPMPADMDTPRATDPLEVRAWDETHDIGFYHDFRYNIFGDGGREYHRGILERYRRRIDRMYDVVRRSRSVFAVVVNAQGALPASEMLRLRDSIESIHPDAEVTLVAMNYEAGEDRDEGSVGSRFLVRNMKRRQHPYDFVKTSWEWDFLEDVKLSGRVSPSAEAKRNATSGMSLWYKLHRKLYLHCKKVIERSNARLRK
jgi:hypothetical protein